MSILGMNSFNLAGRLLKKPRIVETPEGVRIAYLYIQTANQYQDPETGKHVTDHTNHRVRVYQEMADTCAECLSIGHVVIAQGKMGNVNVFTEKGSPVLGVVDLVASHIYTFGDLPKPNTQPSPLHDDEPHSSFQDNLSLETVSLIETDE